MFVDVPVSIMTRYLSSCLRGKRLFLRVPRASCYPSPLLLFADRKHSGRRPGSAKTRPQWPRMARRGGQDTGVGRDVYKSNIDSCHFTLRLPSHRCLALGSDSAVYSIFIVLSRRRLIAWLLSSRRRLG